MKFDNTANAGTLIMLVVLVVVILVSGAYGAVMLQKADAGYNVTNDTNLGQTSETNQDMISGIMGAWPILGVIGVALLIVFALAFLGGKSGR